MFTLFLMTSPTVSMLRVDTISYHEGILIQGAMASSSGDDDEKDEPKPVEEQTVGTKTAVEDTASESDKNVTETSEEQILDCTLSDEKMCKLPTYNPKVETEEEAESENNSSTNMNETLPTLTSPNGSIPTLNETSSISTSIREPKKIDKIEIMVPGDFPIEGSVFECQYNMVNSGMPPAEAAKECGVDTTVPDLYGDQGISTIQGLIHSGGGKAGVDCSDMTDPRGPNPAAAGGIGSAGPKGPGGVSASKDRVIFTAKPETVEQMVKITEVLTVVATVLGAHVVIMAAAVGAEAAGAAAGTVAVVEAFVGGVDFGYAGSELFDIFFDTEEPEDPGPSEETPEGEEIIFTDDEVEPIIAGEEGGLNPKDDIGSQKISCSNIMDMINQCQQKAYANLPDCQKLTSGCKGNDPTVAQAGQTDPDSGGINCNTNFDPLEVKKIVLPCETTAKPIGPDQDPCNVTLTMTGYDPCSSPDPHGHYAMTDPDGGPQGGGPSAPKEGCHVTVISLFGTDLATPKGPCPPDGSGEVKGGCTIPDPNSNPSPVGPGPGPKDVSRPSPGTIVDQNIGGGGPEPTDETGNTDRSQSGPGMN